ncbi:MAG TPA: metallophosphoesterase [Longimicrobiales bacterium]|nr:metallophosphoesterase [Longimicrobiales bacterium]
MDGRAKKGRRGGTAPGREGEGGSGRLVRVAAMGDIHYNGTDRTVLTQLEAAVAGEADVLVVCGDLTTHGQPTQMLAVAEALARMDLPVVAVFGNHDHEGEAAEENTRILSDHGIHVLDGDTVVIDGVGFAGVKGFAGGFGRGALAPFGERLIKEFVQSALDEALKLENALRQLQTEVKVAVLHYAPIEDTIHGEPEVIWPFLGSSRLLQPIDTMQPDVVFHGHAHHGSPEGRTPGGVPVYNVSLPLLSSRDAMFHLWSAPAPERRTDEASAGAPR